tara:strand:- start:1324 stop:1527 length:204 start_codon:yes stop_codon:yes gene_type:complete
MLRWLLWLLDPCGYEFRYGDIVVLEGEAHAHGDKRIRIRRIKRSTATPEQIAEHQQRMAALDARRSK